jgi:hypothetical protein
VNISEHAFYKTSFSYIDPWLPPENRNQIGMKGLLDDESLAPIKRFDIGSFLYCMTLYDVFKRIENIIQLTSRSLYSRKGENKTFLKKEWMVYNYHNYMTVYQSVLDIVAHLTNEALDLGIPSKECTPHLVSINRRVKSAGIKPIFNEMSLMTEKHRTGKNLLLHYGRETIPPVRTGGATSFNIVEIAKERGWELDKSLASVEEFLAVKDQESLTQLMTEECNKLKGQVGLLLDKLFPQYQKMREFYI